MKKQIALLAGDGIGPDIMKEAVRVLEAIGERFGHSFSFTPAAVGGAGYDVYGTPLPEETLKACKDSDAILFGAVGGPKWDSVPKELRPEQGILGLRKELNLFANLRPVNVYDALVSASTLKEEVIRNVDVLIVRELTGGIYFGTPSERREINGEEGVVDTLVYKRSEMERIIRIGFESALLRSKKVTSVDKANVLESSRMWREVAEEVSKDFPEVELEHMLVDNAAMQLVRSPRSFDVIVTENLFGDILSDEASMISGSLGLLPSASLSGKGPGLFEPIHGSAPDIAGLGQANPLAAIASVAMLLKYGFEWEEEAQVVDQAIAEALATGARTSDIAEGGEQVFSTSAMTNAVLKALKASTAV
ncbi:3-isopropylmalate dehydrogenase [Shouchella shacheensis]|uniref:3-isopropylmalate dehydrogenase n=1 Tax=Shouchella shacheensis TaxID=1649580 RepID=UPI00073FCCA8|nr:3-isopropylmalate dehydrogenase [Shouchella shacheensis]